MGRFHRHDDGTVHSHDHDHDHDHDQARHSHGHAHEHGHPHDHEHPHEHGHGHGHPKQMHTHEHVHDHHNPAHDHDHTDIHPEYGDHSGYATGYERVTVLEDIFEENDARAAENQHNFKDHGVGSVNLMSSPGSGKTELLARTLSELEGKLRVGIIEGDIETDLDAARLGGHGAQISLLNTAHGFGGECHLDAPMVAHALAGLDLHELDLVLIENVGNLVCPAEFEVGAERKAMVYSVTEGEDKPKKYPVMFSTVDLVVINKIDLLPYLDFDMALFRSNLEAVNPGVHVIELSAKTGEGVDRWIEWLTEAAR